VLGVTVASAEWKESGPQGIDQAHEMGSGHHDPDVSLVRRQEVQEHFVEYLPRFKLGSQEDLNSVSVRIPDVEGRGFGRREKFRCPRMSIDLPGDRTCPSPSYHPSEPLCTAYDRSHR